MHYNISSDFMIDCQISVVIVYELMPSEPDTNTGPPMGHPRWFPVDDESLQK